jgi:hypothetical protein
MPEEVLVSIFYTHIERYFTRNWGGVKWKFFEEE